MIDIFRFAERIKPLIDDQTPFMAYWHPHGYAILRTGPVERTETVYVLFAYGVKTTWEYHSPQDADRACNRFFRKYGRFPGVKKEVRQLKPLKASKAGISEFRRIMRKFEHADPYARTVEFDGVNLVTHGDIDFSL